MRSGEDWTEETYAAAEEAIGYAFSDRELLKTCFTHSTYTEAFGGENNERLEFLGDAVLQLAVTETLFERSGADEGKLTARRQHLVSESALTETERRAGFMRFLRYSGGEHNIEGKTASNLVEAIVAGIYRDSGGLREVKAFLKRFLVETGQEKDPKTRLQEYVQEVAKTTPNYFSCEREGRYESTVCALGQKAHGSGTSKKAAEMAAADALYGKLIHKGKDL